jgi:hypothetical protein
MVTLHDRDGKALTVGISEGFSKYDVTTCNPSLGFTALDALVKRRSGLRLGELCYQANERREVCVLPPDTVRNGGRMMLTPSVKVLGETGRLEAQRLMCDLFDATQHPAVTARSLHIIHFDSTRRYSRDHIQGVFDAILQRSESSFGLLERIDFKVSSHRAAFEAHLIAALVRDDRTR